MRVLMVEDEVRLAATVSRGLVAEGSSLTSFTTGQRDSQKRNRGTTT